MEPVAEREESTGDVDIMNKAKDIKISHRELNKIQQQTGGLNYLADSIIKKHLPICFMLLLMSTLVTVSL